MLRAGAFSIPPAPLVLTLAGLIPFLACAGIFVAPGGDPIQKQQAGFLLTAYGAVILSFLGGVRWGVEMLASAGGGGPRLSVLGLSVVGALTGWAGLGLAVLHPTFPTDGVFLLLALGLALHWLWDLSGRIALPAWYDGLRTLATAGAVASLLLAWWAA